MRFFVTLVIGFQPLTNTRKNSVLDVTVVLDPPLVTVSTTFKCLKVHPRPHPCPTDLTELLPLQYLSR